MGDCMFSRTQALREYVRPTGPPSLVRAWLRTSLDPPLKGDPIAPGAPGVVSYLCGLRHLTPSSGTRSRTIKFVVGIPFVLENGAGAFVQVTIGTRLSPLIHIASDLPAPAFAAGYFGPWSADSFWFFSACFYPFHLVFSHLIDERVGASHNSFLEGRCRRQGFGTSMLNRVTAQKRGKRESYTGSNQSIPHGGATA